MSHAATKWAIEQRGVKPAAKIVLWHLADRYNPDLGCFPSQERLAADCEMSRSSLNDHLAALEGLGLIAREPQRDPVTSKIVATRYRLAFEPDFPCPKIGQGAVSENPAEPCPNSGESRVRNSDTNLVREPVREPLSAQAREAAERESEQDSSDREAERNREAEARRRWQRLKREYRGAAVDDLDKAERLFMASSEADQAAMLEKLPAWNAFLVTQRRRPPLQDFITGRRWELIPEGPQAEAAPRPGGTPDAEPRPYVTFGFADQGWWAMVWRAFKAGDLSQLKNRIDPDWGIKRGIVVKTPEAPDQAELDALVRVSSDSPEFSAWAKHVEARFRAIRMGHVRMPRPTKAPYVWLPAQWPPNHGAPTLSEVDEVMG